MRATETGFRCDPCTDATPEPAECQGCEFCTERGVCTQADDGRCPITMPKDAPHRGPLTAAEETRGRACGELAAKLIADGCPDCSGKAIDWVARIGTPRIEIDWSCGHCKANGVLRLIREGCYQVRVIGDMLEIRRDACRMLYRISKLEAVAVWTHPDHEVVTFRAGHETQTFAVDTAERAFAAIQDAWWKP